jgi:hypothetical protein
MTRREAPVFGGANSEVEPTLLLRRGGGGPVAQLPVDGDLGPAAEVDAVAGEARGL